MKDIIKIFGLPRSGTNLIEKSLILNIKNYVCQLSDSHPNYHYLGWKHGLPKDIKTYDIISEKTQEKVFFIFMIREFKTWQNSIFLNHLGSWEFPLIYFDMGWDKFIYNTPQGPEFYKNAQELYDIYNNEYKKFTEINPDRAIVITFEELQKSQSDTIKKISNKFNFELIDNKIYEINKRIDSGGRINDFINKK